MRKKLSEWFSERLSPDFKRVGLSSENLGWLESAQRLAEPVRGCSPQIATAIKTFLEEWKPYSIESQRHFSIFRLMHDLIDPAWSDLCENFFVKCEFLDHVWNRSQQPRNFMTFEQQEERGNNIKYIFVGQNERTSTPCRGKINRPTSIFCRGKVNERYILSDIARYYGFYTLDRFLQELYRACHNRGDCLKPTLGESIDSLRRLASVCLSKKSKITNKENKTVCRLCNQETEIFSSLNDDTSELKKRSTQYCSFHRSKDISAENAVRASYGTAKRNQKKFQQELSRLQRQCRGWLTRKPQANSGNAYVDIFIYLLVDYHKLGLDDEHDASNDPDQKRLRKEARNFLDRKISDRKKEIVALLALGNNQSSVANQLGISRSAVTQLLQSIPEKYRLDILIQQQKHVRTSTDRFIKNHESACLTPSVYLVLPLNPLL